MEKIFLNYKDLSLKDARKISQGSVIPRPIAWITTLNENQSVNLAPFSYFNLISPSLIMVSFIYQNGQSKDTYRNIVKTQEAVVHISTEDLIAQIDESGIELDYNESEVEYLNLSVNESKLIKTPYLSLSKISFETVLEKTESFKHIDSDEVECNVVFLRIVGVHLDSSVYDQNSGYILMDKLKPIARLSGVNYGEVKQLDFKRKY